MAGVALPAPGTQPGSVIAWGKYFDGSGFVPVSVPKGLTNVVAMAGGAGHSLALLQNGTVAVWGFNYYPIKSKTTPLPTDLHGYDVLIT